MAQLRHDYSQFVDRDVEIVVVGPEDARAFSKYWQRTRSPSSCLPDPHIQRAQALRAGGQPVQVRRMPAQVFIDKAGVARFVHYGHNAPDIPKNEEVLALADEINASTRVDA